MQREKQSLISNFWTLTECLSDFLRDPLYVQGGGGNISIKSRNLMAVKASGTSLRDITFDSLALLSYAGNTDTPLLLNDAKPSMETLLHQVIPRKYVVHLHALPFFFTQQYRSEFHHHLYDYIWEEVEYLFVNYVTPGNSLGLKIAAVRAESDAKNKLAELYGLQCHGIVVASDDIHWINRLLNFKAAFRRLKRISTLNTINNLYFGYERFLFSTINDRFKPHDLKFAIRSFWCLSPDHLLLLGDKVGRMGDKSVIVCDDVAIYLKSGVSDAIREQFDFFLTVLANLETINMDSIQDSMIRSVFELEDEQYRLNLLTGR